MENRKGEDNKVYRGVWKVVETKARETKMAEIKEGREKKRERKEARRERVKEERKEEKEIQKRENNRSKESSRRIGDLG